MVRRWSGRFLRDRTDEEGAFEIGSVPAGTYFLEISRRGGRRGGSTRMHREQITVHAGMSLERQFYLSTGEISFAIEDAKSGKPLDRARITLVLAAEAGNLEPAKWQDLPSRRRINVRSGKAEAKDLKVGEYLYVVSGRSIVPKVQKVYVGMGGASSPEVVKVEQKEQKKQAKQQGK